MSIYDLFAADNKAEIEGVELVYGKAKVRVARAGGSNTKYLKSLDRHTRGLRKQIQHDQLSNEDGNNIMREVFAESIILGWTGMVGRDGKEIPFSKEACLKLLKELPDLFADIQEQAGKFALYREIAREGEAGN